MNCLLTGVRPGEYVTGLRTQAKDCILQLTGAIVPPDKDVLNTMRQEGVYPSFVRGLTTIEFFTDMSYSERDEWLVKYESSEDIYFQDVKGLKVRVVVPGGDVLGLEEDTLTNLSVKYRSIDRLYNAFPRNPASPGLKGRHTLLLRRSLWAVSVPFESEDASKGVLTVSAKDLTSSRSYEGPALKLNGVEHVLITESPVSTVSAEWNIPDDSLYELVREWPPSYLKSLMQKIVRLRPRYVQVTKDTSIYAADLLRTCTLALFAHPGSFVPDIQKFVTGQESALKRACISLIEDGYADVDTLKRLSYGALLAQRLPGWKASVEVVEECVNVLIASLKDTRYFDYSRKATDVSKTVLSSVGMYEVLENVKTCGSFLSDIQMIERLCYEEEPPTLVTTGTRPSTMHISAFIDAHCLPNVVYLLEGGYDTPTPEILGDIFREYTGVNTRKATPRKKAVRRIEKAQRRMYLYLSGKRELVKKVESKESKGALIAYALDDSIIAGMVGTFETDLRDVGGGAGKAITTIDPNSIRSLVTVRKPSRASKLKGPLLDDDIVEEVQRGIRSLLRKGVKLDATSAPIGELRGAKVYISKAGVYVESVRTSSKKSTSKKVSSSSPYEKVKWSRLSRGKRRYDFEVDVVKRWLKSTPIEARRRLYTLMTCSVGVVSFPKLGRDGKALATSVPAHRDDRLAYLYFIELCEATNMLGGTLVMSKGRRVYGNITDFESTESVVLDRLKRLIHETLVDTRGENTTKRATFGDVGETLGRSLWPHQLTAIEQMERSGRKGNFVYADVGSGKTKLVLEYIVRALSSEDRAPISAVLYTLPSSAMSSVIHEVEAYGFDYRIVVPIKGGKRATGPKVIREATLTPGVINLIEHDYLRRIVGSDSVCESMSTTLFVIDEVHKALNNTLRTGAALYLSKLCQEFVAMTGTPVIDTDTYKLQWWLECIVDFKINPNNFWVAACGIVSRRVAPSATMVKRDVEVDVLKEDRKEYLTLAPTSCGGRNVNVTPGDVRKAMGVCYRSTDVGMVDTALSKLKNGVFMVANDAAHQVRLRDALVSRGVSAKSIFLIDSKSTLYLAPGSADSKRYKVVITTVRKCEGYTLTTLQTIVTSVYASNNATREQLEGRINRPGTPYKKLYMYTVHAGILSYILERHDSARSLSEAIKAISS